MIEQPWWKEPTKAQWMSFAAAWLGWVLDAFDFTVFLLVMPEIAKEFGVSYTATAGSLTLTLLVRLAGGYVAGLMADRWGRRLPLMLSMIWFAVCDGSIAFAGSFTMILVLRTLFGFGMGAEWTAGTTLAMENWPTRTRGLASGVLQGSWAIGYLLAGVAAAWVVPVYGWRALFVLAAAPALLALPIRMFVPESEEWKKNKDRPKAHPATFTPVIWARLAWASAMLATGFGAYYGLTGLYATMLKVEHTMAQGAVSNLVVLFNLGMMLGAILCGLLAAKRSIAWAVAIPALLALPILPLYVGLWPALLSIGAFFGGMFGAGYSGVTPLLLTSLFPAEIRARAVGLAYHLGAFGAAFVPMGIAAASEGTATPLSTTIAVVCGASLLAMVALLALRPEESTSTELAGTAPSFH